MSGGFTPSLKRSGVELSDVSFLASEHYSVKRVGITLSAASVTVDSDGNKIIDAGTFVTPITGGTASEVGKYGVLDGEATDGREAPSPDVSGYLLEGVNLRDGDVVCGLLIHGSVLQARVVPSPVPDEVREAVAGRITFQ